LLREDFAQGFTYFCMTHKNMEHIHELLKKEGYVKVKFRVSRTNHLLIKASINGVDGEFILDTGASNSCVDFSITEHFKLNPQDSSTMAAGAGAIGMNTQLARNNLFKTGRWIYHGFELVVFDLSHVNQALVQHKAKPVHGILGADVLLKGKAIIDYANHLLFLKK
jgi:hypothetical protein